MIFPSLLSWSVGASDLPVALEVVVLDMGPAAVSVDIADDLVRGPVVTTEPNDLGTVPTGNCCAAGLNFPRDCPANRLEGAYNY